MKPTKTWIVITNGARSRILLNEGPGKGVEEVEGGDFRVPHPEDREIMADRPGRAFESADGRRHAYEAATDPHQKNKTDFVKELAVRLEAAQRNALFDRVIIVAAPKALSDLRSFLPGEVKDLIVGELAKDLTRIPDEEIADHLDGLIIL